MEVYPIEFFENDIKLLENDASHCLMKHHFPNYYKHLSFYKNYVQYNKQRKKVLEEEKKHPVIKSTNFLLESEDSAKLNEPLNYPKKVWAPNKIKEEGIT